MGSQVYTDIQHNGNLNLHYAIFFQFLTQRIYLAMQIEIWLFSAGEICQVFSLFIPPRFFVRIRLIHAAWNGEKHSDLWNAIILDILPSEIHQSRL
jgi:hypothetical protein